MRKLKFLTFLFCIFFYQNAYALEKITIRGGNSEGIPILIKKITADKVNNLDLADQIIKLSDLQLKESKLFEMVYDEKQKSILKKFFNPLYEPEFFPYELNFHLSYEEISNSLKGEFEIIDVRKQEAIIHKTIYSSPDRWQRISNKISNSIFYEFTGVAGIFDTEIVFISEKGPLENRQKRIARMDLYGSNFHYITTGRNTVLTPKLSDDGDKIYYVSYVNLIPKLYVYDRTSNRAKTITSQDQMEFSPSLSADNKELFFTATEDGNSEIMVMDLPNGKPFNISKHYAIDTSPALSPDGRKLAYVSDRYGKPQILFFDSFTKETKRLDLGAGTYQDPTWSPDGRYLAFVKIYQNKFSIGVVNVINLQSKILLTDYKIESPVFAPNSKYIMFTKKDADKIYDKKAISYLFIVDLNGNIIKRVPTPTDASEADWKKIHD